MLAKIRNFVKTVTVEFVYELYFSGGFADVVVEVEFRIWWWRRGLHRAECAVLDW